MKIDIKKPKTIIALAGVLVVAIIVILYSTSDWRMRNALKNDCGIGMDCTCFSNVVDNRLDKKQVYALHAFMKSVKRRPTTSILEFTDETSARGISAAISLCRPAPAQPQQPTQPAKKK